MAEIETEPMRVLDECRALLTKKGADYQSQNSTVKQADYYPNGVITILDIIHAKKLRLQSVIDNMQSGGKPNFESIEDSAKDMANYCAILVAYTRKKIDGQDQNKNIFNR